MRAFFLALVAVLILGGCAAKQMTHKEGWVILIKSPKLKFNDIGYILYNDDKVELQLYSAGSSVESFSIDDYVCTQSGCMSKSAFNAEYLNAAYDENFLKDLLTRKAIFKGKNLYKNKNGFEQHLVNKAYDITYRVTPNKLYFKDTKNRILFKLTRTKQ